jgi:hypothetical protein
MGRPPALRLGVAFGHALAGGVLTNGTHMSRWRNWLGLNSSALALLARISHETRRATAV